MPRRSIPFLLLGLVGFWAGSGLGAISPPPAVTVPTITVTLPPPLPTVTVPPSVEPPATPETPAPVEPSVDLPVPAPTPPAPASLPPALRVAPPAPPSPSTTRAGSAPDGNETRRPRDARRQDVRPLAREAGAPTARSDRVTGVTASARRPVRENDLSFFGPIGAGLGTLDNAAIPTALFAMALLAVFLLGLASMPLPLRASWAGAMLVHQRGAIALAGAGALAVAVATYLLL